MNPELHLRVAGVLQILLALLHLDFPRRFAWRVELGQLSLLNRQMFHVHTLFVCLVLALFGALSLFAPAALLEPTRLARLVLAGIAVFWLVRLYCQWFVYDSQLWRGKPFEMAMHCLFSLLWGYLVAVYGGAWYSLG